MKTTHLFATSIITALTNPCLFLVIAIMMGNHKSINSVLSKFDEQTVNFILSTVFSSEMFNTLAVISVLTYSMAVVIRLKSERRVDWVLIVATLTLPISLFFLLA